MRDIFFTFPFPSSYILEAHMIYANFVIDDAMFLKYL